MLGDLAPGQCVGPKKKKNTNACFRRGRQPEGTTEPWSTTWTPLDEESPPGALGQVDKTVEQWRGSGTLAGRAFLSDRFFWEMLEATPRKQGGPGPGSRPLPALGPSVNAISADGNAGKKACLDLKLFFDGSRRPWRRLFECKRSGKREP